IQLQPNVSGLYVIVNTGLPGGEDPVTPNNSKSAPTSVTTAPADLQITNVSGPATSFSGEPVTLSWTVKDFGSAAWSGTHYWTDEVYFSNTPTFIPNLATRLGSFVHANQPPLGANQTYTETRQVVLPRGIEGPYYLHVLVDNNPLTG